MSVRPLSGRLPGRIAASTLGLAVGLGLVLTGLPAYAAPDDAPDEGPRLDAAVDVDPDTPPILTPDDGAWLEGTVGVRATPRVPGDDVTGLTVDGQPIDADVTTGVSRLSFEVSSGAMEASYPNRLVVNGEHTVDVGGAALGEVPVFEIPNDVLVQGDNVVEVLVGSVFNGTCDNFDDYSLSDFRLELLEEVADGEENEFTYAFGDGTCGSNSSLLTRAELHFHVAGEPGGTTGLATELDTTSLGNGPHTITATTAAGVEVTHDVRVNNGPAGAPVITPTDGTLLSGATTVIATATGGVTSVRVDGAEPAAAETLASGTARLRFTVGSNSIEARYANHVLVNGHRVDIGGDWVSQAVTLELPNRYLVPGRNEITVVTGDVNGTSGGATCANRDDFALSAISLVPADGTATPNGVAASYPMGDGTCGSSTTALPEATLVFDIAGATTTRSIETAAGGTAVLTYTMGGNGADDGFPNTIAINGNELPFGPQEAGAATLSFPNEWLVPGVNVLDIVAGSVDNGTCDNFDDFSVTGLALAPSSGSATRLTRMTAVAGTEVPVAIGDGTCGSSFNASTRWTQLFRVDTPAAGRRVDLDTTTLADGDHTLTATSAGGQTAQRTVTVDNTAPAVASSTPSDGQRLTGAVAFDVQYDDLAGVAGTPAATLDGEPLEPGDLVGPGLAPGPHVILVEVTDALGNSATRRIRFQNAGIPAEPAALSPAHGTTGVGPEVDLEARVSSPGGNGVTATFREAEVVSPEAAFAGEADRIPTTLEVAGEESVDAASLSPVGGSDLASPASTEVSFQRYDLAVGPVAADAPLVDRPVVRWQGVVDPERIAALRVWDAAAEEWVALASTRGAVETDTVLVATVAPRLVVDGTVHVMVTGEDPMADDIDPGDPAQNELDDPASYDFSLAHYTDTQYLAEGAAGGTYQDFDGVTEDSDVMTAVEQALWTRSYRDTTEWIAENADERRISYVAHTGDIIENNINDPSTVGVVNPDTGLNELEEQVRGEFAAASEFQDVLDDAGVVSQVVAGNHDNQRGTETGPDARFNTWFGPERYEAADDAWGAEASYGGPWKEGDNQNNYVLFSAGGLDFVGLGLSYGVTREEARWADGVLKRYADRNAIILTHDYLAPSTSPDGRGGGLMGDGSILYRLLVEENPNVFLVLAGHRHGVATNVKRGVGVTMSNGVVELLADYQAYTVSAEELGLDGDLDGDGDVDHAPTDRLRFGASFLRLLQVDVERSVMSVDTYSPHLDDLGATEYDISGSQTPRYNGYEDQMVLPIDLDSRTTSVTTDSVAAFVPARTLGTDTVADGGTAELAWTGLEPGSVYGWFVDAGSAGGGESGSMPAAFATAEPTTPTIVVDDVDVRFGDDVEIEVAVDAGDSGDLEAEGEVVLRDGSEDLATAVLVDGAATLTVPAGTAPGTYAWTVVYEGSGFVAGAQAPVEVTVVASDAPLALTEPAISGTPAVGETLTADPGTWDEEGVTFDYRWLRDGEPIAGADGSTYEVIAEDIRTALRVEITATLTGATPGTATSSAVLVGKAATTTEAQALTKAVGRGRPVRVRATVTAIGLTPGGTVVVTEGGRVVGTATLVDGTVVVRVARLAPGAHRLVVAYRGTATTRASQADPVTVRVRRR